MKQHAGHSREAQHSPANILDIPGAKESQKIAPYIIYARDHSKDGVLDVTGLGGLMEAPVVDQVAKGAAFILGSLPDMTGKPTRKLADLLRERGAAQAPGADDSPYLYASGLRGTHFTDLLAMESGMTSPDNLWGIAQPGSLEIVAFFGSADPSVGKDGIMLRYQFRHDPDPEDRAAPLFDVTVHPDFPYVDVVCGNDNGLFVGSADLSDVPGVAAALMQDARLLRSPSSAS